MILKAHPLKKSRLNDIKRLQNIDNPGQARMRMKARGYLFGAAGLLLVILTVVIVLVGKDDRTPPEAGPPPDGIAFFDIGAGTLLSEPLRERLRRQLGSDAIEYRGLINLEVNYRGFLKDHFPELDELQRQLNYAPDERIEHNTTRLMYRYARRRNLPFRYVELLFSNYTRKPLVFRIDVGEQGQALIDSISSTYGAPETVQWGGEREKALSWQEKRDRLIVSMGPNRFGDLEYQVTIYFVENLAALAARETAKREKKALEQQRRMEKVF